MTWFGTFYPDYYQDYFFTYTEKPSPTPTVIADRGRFRVDSRRPARTTPTTRPSPTTVRRVPAEVTSRQTNVRTAIVATADNVLVNKSANIKSAVRSRPAIIVVRTEARTAQSKEEHTTTVNKSAPTRVAR